MGLHSFKYSTCKSFIPTPVHLISFTRHIPSKQQPCQLHWSKSKCTSQHTRQWARVNLQTKTLSNFSSRATIWYCWCNIETHAACNVWKSPIKSAHPEQLLLHGFCFKCQNTYKWWLRPCSCAEKIIVNTVPAASFPQVSCSRQPMPFCEEPRCLKEVAFATKSCSHNLVPSSSC